MISRRKIILTAGILALAAVALLYANYNPAGNPWFPKCPFRLLTGFDCPGCGSQRALHHLLHFDFRAAATDNILLIAAIPYIGLAYILDMMKPAADSRAGKLQSRLYGHMAIWIVFSIIIAFWILRNIPAFEKFI